MEHFCCDADGLVRLLEWMERFLELRANQRRIEAKLDIIIKVTKRTDMTAEQEEELKVELTKLDELANAAPKPAT